MSKGYLDRLIIALSTVFIPHFTWAQTGGGSYLTVGMIALVVLVVLAAILLVADNMLKVEAKQSGVELQSGQASLMPNIQRFFSQRLPEYLHGRKLHWLHKGHDINLKGKPSGEIREVEATRYAAQPSNFIGIRPIPKMMVDVGDEVLAGDPLFYDKPHPDIHYCAPFSGEIVEINRGAKRSIMEVVILADKEIRYRQFDPIHPENISRKELRAHLQKAGFWGYIRQRPYNVVPGPDAEPDNIFISTFDTAPLVPEADRLVDGREEAFQKGLDTLNALTDGTVYLGMDGRGEEPPHTAFHKAEGVDKHYFKGPHPAGNVGIQIHHIDPIRPDSLVWTLGVQDVITLGTLIGTGRLDLSRVIAIGGSEVDEPHYVRTHLGANIGDLLGEIDPEGKRIISGDVLSGEQKQLKQYLNAFDDQITVIKEGNYYEMFGWLIPSKLRPTVSKTYPNFMLPEMAFEGDTNKHGERRAFVVTGQYERMLPMDIYPQHLMKAIMVNDIERMEGLGIHELVEEDVALCEFACTSKQPLQRILRHGLDLIQDQT